jgi:hypothetical protein
MKTKIGILIRERNYAKISEISDEIRHISKQLSKMETIEELPLGDYDIGPNYKHTQLLNSAKELFNARENLHKELSLIERLEGYLDND